MKRLFIVTACAAVSVLGIARPASARLLATCTCGSGNVCSAYFKDGGSCPPYSDQEVCNRVAQVVGCGSATPYGDPACTNIGGGTQVYCYLGAA